MVITYQSWIIVGLFIVNLIFWLIMSFISPYCKQILNKGMGFIANIIWLVLLIILSGLFMFASSYCSGDTIGCAWLPWVTIAIIVGLTTWIIVYTSIKDHKYRKLTKNLSEEESRKL